MRKNERTIRQTIKACPARFVCIVVEQTDNDVALYDWLGQGLLNRCDLLSRTPLKPLINLLQEAFFLLGWDEDARGTQTGDCITITIALFTKYY
jgi:hypothetical protein